MMVFIDMKVYPHILKVMGYGASRDDAAVLRIHSLVDFDAFGNCI